MRVRLTLEGVLNRHKYINNWYLRQGLGVNRQVEWNMVGTYAALGGSYDAQNVPQDITMIYNADVFKTRSLGAYCGMFQVGKY